MCILDLAHIFFIINTTLMCIFYTREINLILSFTIFNSDHGEVYMEQPLNFVVLGDLSNMLCHLCWSLHFGRFWTIIGNLRCTR